MSITPAYSYAALYVMHHIVPRIRQVWYVHIDDTILCVMQWCELGMQWYCSICVGTMYDIYVICFCSRYVMPLVFPNCHTHIPPAINAKLMYF